MIANAGIVLFRPFLEREYVSWLSINLVFMYLAATTEEFQRIQKVNVEGVLHCYKHAAVQMIKQGRGGRIVGWSFSHI